MKKELVSVERQAREWMDNFNGVLMDFIPNEGERVYTTKLCCVEMINEMEKKMKFVCENEIEMGARLYLQKVKMEILHNL